MDRYWLRFSRAEAWMKSEQLSRARTDFAQPLAYLEELTRDYEGVPTEYRPTQKPSVKRKRPPPYIPLDQVNRSRGSGDRIASVGGSWPWSRSTGFVRCRLGAAPNHKPRLMGGENDLNIGHPLLSTEHAASLSPQASTREQRAMRAWLKRHGVWDEALRFLGASQKLTRQAWAASRRMNPERSWGSASAQWCSGTRDPRGAAMAGLTHGRMLFGHDHRNAGWTKSVANLRPAVPDLLRGRRSRLRGADMFEHSLSKNFPLAVWPLLPENWHARPISTFAGSWEP